MSDKIYHVQVLSKSKVCPDSVQVQNLSRLCPFSYIDTIFLLDRVWTNSGSECPISVQALDDGQSLDRHLTKFIVLLDNNCTLTTVGQLLDKDCTKFGSLDRDWTETRQSLDFLSNVCPTTRKQGAPEKMLPRQGS